MKYFLIFIISFFISLISTKFFKFFAIKNKIFDTPTTSIKTHKKTIPYLGGLGIAISFFITIIFFLDFKLNLLGIFLASFLMLIIGLIDDLKNLNFKQKLFFQFITATILIFSKLKIQFITLNSLAIILTYIWIIGIINAINLIDIMDGLSSGITIISSLTFFLINTLKEASFVNYISIGLLGSTLGFLIFNFYPAKIFMGDAGSLFIGTILASISLGANYSENNEIAIFSPILILIIPIYDTLYISYKRFQKGQSIFLGSKDHIAIRLKIYGWNTKKIVLTLYLFSIIFSLLAFIIVKSNLYFAIIIYLICIIFLLIIGKKLSKINIYD